MEKLKELRGKIEERRKHLSEIFEAAGPDVDLSKVDSLEGDTTTRVEKIREINDELDDLVKQAQPLEEQEAELTKARREADRLGELREHPGHPAPAKQGERDTPAAKSIGELFTEHEVGTSKKGRSVEIPDVALKTLFETTAGWEPEVTRTGRLVEEAIRPIQVTDVIPSGSTSQQSVVFMEETTFTNNAAEVAEGGAYGEAALALTEQSSPVRKIGVWLPITDEQLEDESQVQGYVNRRLPFMVRQRLDGQIINGDGIAPNLEGLLNVTGIQTQAKGADPIADAVYKAMTKIKVTGRAQPGAVVMHSNDWQEVRLLRTADGIYIWGSPSESAPARLWGLPVVENDVIAEGTALVGDFANYTELASKRGIEMKVSDSHSDYFVNGKQAIRADVRVALVCYRPAALCEVTGI